MKVSFIWSLCAALVLTFGTQASAVTLSPGDLVITELFANPDGGDTTGAEFFEVVNNSDSTINLNGLTFSENDGGNEAFTVIVDAFIAPGEFAVFSSTDSPTLGFAVDINFLDDGGDVSLLDEAATSPGGGFFDIDDILGNGGFTLGNGADEFIIFEGGADAFAAGTEAVIFEFETDNGDPFGSGVSQELSDVSLGDDGVVTPTDFVASTTPLGIADDLASPGAAGNTAGVIPEPGSALLVMLGAAGLGLVRRQR